ncbi:thiol-disulfide oxidoreductase DCC family protein [Cytobacillus sp. Hz8]|uniref:thiol-disulfide oxidoreductase DCC family protein n=1 Tax=Cytobacillus sp. Hz8 TaxID=3347168 RepID=UPI0035D62D48
MKGIILFDGECNFCNGSVQFVLKRDAKAHYQFASLQSEIGKKLLKQYHIPENVDSLVLIEQKQYYLKSQAALRICKNLRGIWKLGSLFFVIPTPIRDVAYDFIAKKRYQWFGKSESCMLPTPDMKKRFLS